jgi:hypothetical protein
MPRGEVAVKVMQKMMVTAQEGVGGETKNEIFYLSSHTLGYFFGKN